MPTTKANDYAESRSFAYLASPKIIFDEPDPATVLDDTYGDGTMLGQAVNSHGAAITTKSYYAVTASCSRLMLGALILRIGLRRRIGSLTNLLKLSGLAT